MHVYLNLPAKIGVVFWMVYAVVTYILYATKVISLDNYTIAFVVGTMLIFLFTVVMIGLEHQKSMRRETKEYVDLARKLRKMKALEQDMVRKKEELWEAGKIEAVGEMEDIRSTVQGGIEGMTKHLRDLSDRTEAYRRPRYIKTDVI